MNNNNLYGKSNFNNYNNYHRNDYINGYRKDLNSHIIEMVAISTSHASLNMVG